MLRGAFGSTANNVPLIRPPPHLIKITSGKNVAFGNVEQIKPIKFSLYKSRFKCQWEMVSSEMGQSFINLTGRGTSDQHNESQQ